MQTAANRSQSPEGEDMEEVRANLLGTLAVKAGLATGEQVEECLRIQQEARMIGGTVPRLGEVMAEKGYLSDEQVQAILRGDFAAAAGSKDMEQPETAGDVREVPVSAPAEEPAAGEQGQAAEAAPLAPSSAKATEGSALRSSEGAKEGAPAEEAKAEPVPTAEAPPEEVPPKEMRKAAPEAVGPLVFGEFRTSQKIGEDSLGILYRAEHVESGRTVALKVIDLSYARDKAFVHRFAEETKKAAALSHPNLRRVIAAGSDKGHLYYASEFVEGNSVRQLIQSERRVSIRASTRIIRAVADALRYAHARDVYHSDIRPSHIMVAHDGGVRLAETGVAKNVRQDARGSAQPDEVRPFYMAPELATPRCVADARSDIYGLGATYFHMVTGKPPFEGDNPQQVFTRMAREEPPPANVVNPGVPFEVSRVIRKMMAPEFRDRFQTMDELIRELDRIENLGTITGAAAVRVESPPASRLPAGSAPAVSPPRGRAAVRKDVRGSGLRAAGRKGARGSRAARGGKGPDEEGRPRGAPKTGSPMLGLLLFVGFLVAAAVMILILVKANQEATARRDRKRRAPMVGQRRFIPTAVHPPGASPERPLKGSGPVTRVETRPKPPERRPPGEGPGKHGRSLLGTGGEFWKGAGAGEPPK